MTTATARPLPAVGDQLPAMSVAVTRTFVVAAAIATRDYQDVHHDHELAQQKGSKDIFINILTSNGLVSRFVTEWAGPASHLASISIRLGVPCYAGDTLNFAGEVTAVDGDRVTVAIKGDDSLGTHVSGNVVIVWPKEVRS